MFNLMTGRLAAFTVETTPLGAHPASWVIACGRR
jgi:hypothetical protein